MAYTQRTINIGRLQEKRRQQKTLAVEIDAAVKAIIVHFEPLDRDLQYIHAIDHELLRIHIATIGKKKLEFDAVTKEIQRLERELGEDE